MRNKVVTPHLLTHLLCCILPILLKTAHLAVPRGLGSSQRPQQRACAAAPSAASMRSNGSLAGASADLVAAGLFCVAAACLTKS